MLGPSSRCFDNTLAKDIPAVPLGQGCYSTLCAGPERLKIQLGSVYYNCPSDTQLVVDGYGGSISCPTNLIICYGVPDDPNYPEFISVNPDAGKPGTPINITGWAVLLVFSL